MAGLRFLGFDLAATPAASVGFAAPSAPVFSAAWFYRDGAADQG